VNALRLVFAGTPEFAVASLDAAHRSGHEVVAVYTQPDRPAGRGRQPSASPVKRRALELGIPVLQPPSLRTRDARRELAALKPDLMIVVAYGLMIPPRVLALPRFGCWNVHASLLPRWRGAAPIQRAIEAGDQQTGVCLMQMDAGLDTGPVLLSQSLAIGDAETAGELHDRLARLGAQTLADGLILLAAGMRPVAQPQSDVGACYARKLDKAEAVLDLGRPAVLLANQVRAFEPWPVAELVLDGERVRVHAAVALPADAQGAAPGTVVAAGREGIDIATGEGVLRLTTLQRDGGKAITAADFLNARRSGSAS